MTLCKIGSNTNTMKLPPSGPKAVGEPVRQKSQLWQAVRKRVSAPTLEQGSEGPEVARLQAELKAAGCDPGEIDGKFGPKTEKALVQYQLRHHLDIDGVAGRATWRELMTDGFEPAKPSKRMEQKAKSWPSPVNLPPPKCPSVEVESVVLAAELAQIQSFSKDLVQGYADATAEAAEAERYRKEAERQLEALPDGGDATPILNGLAEKNAQLAARHAGESEAYKLAWWVAMVKSGAPWDLKNADPVWKNDKLMYGGKPLRSDDMGNIHYGYVGSALFCDDVLKYGAGLAQAFSDVVNAAKSNDPQAVAEAVGKFIDSLRKGDFGDNPGDATAIQRGIDARRERV